jgi:SAM-dependent methyltransferase
VISALPLTEVERWLYAHLPPEPLESARAIYELMPSQSHRTLAEVYVPLDPRSASHWSDVARVADYVAHIPPDARRVLDVGPGDGWPSLPVARRRPEVTVVGVDPSPLRARVCSENAARLGIGNARFVVGDADRLPFADAAFDAVIAASSLEEARDPDAVVRELARVLRPGGVLRASYQDWRLPAPELETVDLWAGERASGEPVLLYTYVRRVQSPAFERRYTLLLPASGPPAEAHADGLVAAAAATRAFGDAVLTPALGVALLEGLAPYALRSTVVEMRRWDTEWLIEALRGAGFASVRGTVHPGEVARHVARDVIASGAVEAFALVFEDVASAVGRAAGARDGRELIEAVR